MHQLSSTVSWLPPSLRHETNRSRRGPCPTAVIFSSPLPLPWFSMQLEQGPEQQHNPPVHLGSVPETFTVLFWMSRSRSPGSGHLRSSPHSSGRRFSMRLLNHPEPS